MTDETKPIRDNCQTHILVAASPSWQDRAGSAEPAASGYVTARELLREVGDLGADRVLDVLRAARLDAGDEAVWPALWRQALHAVSLCRRAAEIAARR
jgi:hypothetical protein